MAAQGPTLTQLAQRGEWRALEDRWLAIIENENGDRQDMLEALATLNQSGQAQRAADMGWTWLETCKEKARPGELLELARELMVRCGDSDDMRREVIGFYKDVFADRPEIDSLIDASGLLGGRSPRRAIRTLDMCLSLKVGDYLVHRTDDHVGQVVSIDVDGWNCTVKMAREEETLDADALALNWDPVEPHDFRVLLQARPDKLTEIVDSDPVALIIGILQSRHGKIDSDHLEPLLVPRIIPLAKWSTWWSKVRTALRRCPNVIVEGRNPIVLTYHAAGQTLEEEIAPSWRKAQTPAQRLMVIETYFREAKARSLQPNPVLIARLYNDLKQRVAVSRKGSPADALTEALVIDRLAVGASLPQEAASSAREILAACDDPASIFNAIEDSRFYIQALELVRETLPDRWVELYLRLLPTAPLDACDTIARDVEKTDRIEELVRIVRELPSDLDRYLDSVCWLWRGPGVAALEPVPRRELLPKLLDYLGTVTRSGTLSTTALKHAREMIRTTLSYQDYKHYRQVIAEMDAGMASTIHRSVDRMEGLGQVVRHDLLKIVREIHPTLVTKVRVDPWLNDGIIFCTAAGMQRQEANLNYLINVKIPENAKAIGEAAAHGDLSENSEFKFALEEKDLLQARKIKMQNELSLARLLTVHDIDTVHVNIGTRVTLAAVDAGDKRMITILGPWEADVEKGIYNYRAPMCLRMKGLKVGDSLQLEEDGQERSYRIELIENALSL